jgi:hypothetical protein
VSIRAEVIAAGEHWSTAQRRLVRLVVELDDSGEWNADGSVTCAHWVASALGIEVCTAREWLRVGRALRRLSTIDGAFESDQLSYSKVRALTRVATPQNEAELCRLALRVAAGRLPHALAAWLARHETPEETETRQRNATALRTWTDPDGLQYDHVPDFEETGHTIIEELFLRCSKCHRDRHGQAPRRE